MDKQLTRHSGSHSLDSSGFEFTDRFSKQAALYARYRPSYPQEIFEYLSSLTPEHELALDVATGNGQAASGLADHYAQVIATDASASQLKHAIQRDNIRYLNLPAELTDQQLVDNQISDGSFDVICVASGVHWFELKRFHEVVQRLLKKPSGVYAIWGTTFRKMTLGDARLDSKYQEFVQTYKNRQGHYRSLEFPFDEIGPDLLPQFEYKSLWNLDDLCGFLKTWSAVQLAVENEPRADSVADFRKNVQPLWGAENFRLVRMPIFIRVGRFRSD